MDKKAFFSDQCREIEENKRMGKSRDLFKKIRDTKGTYRAKMGTMKNRNVTEIQKQKVLRRCSKNAQKNYTKIDLHDSDNHDGVINHLEPGILECEVKWTLGSITMNKASGGDGIPVVLFQILKDDANNNPVYETSKETLMYRTVLWTLWEKERVGRFGRMALKHVKYHV